MKQIRGMSTVYYEWERRKNEMPCFDGVYYDVDCLPPTLKARYKAGQYSNYDEHQAYLEA